MTMGYVPDWSRQDHKKTSAAKPKEGVKSMGSLFHGQPAPKIQKAPKTTLFAADGTPGGVEEALLKQEGLKASANDSMSFLERLRAGNIDEAGSEAYNRFGAGRGRLERGKASGSLYEDAIPTRTTSTQGVVSDRPLSDPMYQDYGPRGSTSETASPSKPAEAAPARRSSASAPANRAAANPSAPSTATSKTSNAALSDDSEMRKQQEAAKRELGAGMYQPNEAAEYSFRMKNEIDEMRASAAEAEARKARKRQADLKASGVPSAPRIGASLMDRGRSAGNYADGGMVKGKRKC